MINYFISILGKFPLDCILQIVCILKVTSVTSLVVQRPRLCTPDAGGPGSISGKETRSHLLQLSLHESESESHSVVSDALRPHELYSPSNSLGMNTGVGSLSLLQVIFPNQGSSQPRYQTQVSHTAGTFFTN